MLRTRKTRQFEQTKSVQKQIRDIVDTISWYKEYVINIAKPKTSEDLNLAVERWVLENSDTDKVITRDASVYLGYVRLKTQENKVLDVPVYVTLGNAGGFQVKYIEKKQIDDIKKYSKTTSISELATLYNVTQSKIKEILNLSDDVTYCIGSYKVYITVRAFIQTKAYLIKVLAHEVQHCIETVRDLSNRYEKSLTKIHAGKDLTFKDWISFMSNDNEFYAHLTDMVTYVMFNTQELKKRYGSAWSSMKRKLLSDIQGIINMSTESLKKEFDEKIKTEEIPFNQSSISNTFKLSQLLIYTSAFSTRKWKILTNKLKELYTVIKYS